MFPVFKLLYSDPHCILNKQSNLEFFFQKSSRRGRNKKGRGGQAGALSPVLENSDFGKFDDEDKVNTVTIRIPD